jgi:hypothetical protein
MRHAGSNTDAMRGTVGGAANLTVSDSAGPPRFAKWKPHPRASLAPPMLQTARGGYAAALAKFPRYRPRCLEPGLPGGLILIEFIFELDRCGSSTTLN